MALTAETRERIRRNVGYPFRGVRLHPPAAVAEAEVFRAERLFVLRPGAPAEPGPAPTPAPAPTPLPITDGHVLSLTSQLLATSREIIISDLLGFPYQIRRVTLAGNYDETESFSIRILVSDDNDTTQTTNPTGTDVIRAYGDVLGTADPGVWTNMIRGPVVFEPYYSVRRAGTRIKLKVHNNVAATRTMTAILCLDELR